MATDSSHFAEFIGHRLLEVLRQADVIHQGVDLLALEEGLLPIHLVGDPPGQELGFKVVQLGIHPRQHDHLLGWDMIGLGQRQDLLGQFLGGGYIPLDRGG